MIATDWSAKRSSTTAFPDPEPIDAEIEVAHGPMVPALAASNAGEGQS